MEVTKTTLPIDSLLAKRVYDYSDSYMSELNRVGISSVELVRAFLSSTPNWVKALMGFRNALVTLFGLKTGARADTTKDFNGEPGGRVGLFKVFDKTETELIIGEDDKHLNFRVSLSVSPLDEKRSQITMSTVVDFNNRFGKLYFLPVKPIHKLVVPIMLRQTIKELESNVHG